MEGQVTLSIEEYQELIDKVNDYKSLETRFRICKQELERVEQSYHEMLVDKIYQENIFSVQSIWESNDDYSRQYLFKIFIKDYHMDSILEINAVIEELIEMFKERENAK